MVVNDRSLSVSVSEKHPTTTVLNGSNYDLAPDGKRIVAFVPAEAPEVQKAQDYIVFLENFFDELRRKAPVGK